MANSDIFEKIEKFDTFLLKFQKSTQARSQGAQGCSAKSKLCKAISNFLNNNDMYDLQ